MVDDDPSLDDTLSVSLSTSTGDQKTDEMDFDNMDPREVFAHFDSDGSGMISLKEFKAMLVKLNINMSEAKALKYFKMCDCDDSGEIDFEEFKVALFACDPNTGNTRGFVPNSLLTPLDAFEMFDEDASGKIDEDEFFFILDYLKLNVSDERQEKLFAKYDKDGSGSIDYEEFKQIWLSVVDVKKELSDRGVSVPKFATKRQLQRMLARIIDEEEEAERKAMAEAEQWRAWRQILDKKNVSIKRARRRAEIELSRALDAAGQVYVFGRSASFGAPEQKVDELGLDKMAKLWARRVTAGKRDFSDPTANTLDDLDAIDVDKLRAELRDSPFRDLSVATNTVALWGKRVVQCALADDVALALSDLGEMWVWGGVDHWWQKVEPDAYWCSHWRGHSTPRSQLLLGTSGQLQPAIQHVSGLSQADEDDDPAEALRSVLQYFDAWQPPPGDKEPLRYYGDVLLPKIEYTRLKSSLEIRGKTPGEATKRQLLDTLYRDICLEKKVLGERAHRRIRQVEEEIRQLSKRRRSALAKRLKLDIVKLWAPLREIQAEEDARGRAKREAMMVEDVARREHKYLDWRRNIEAARRRHDPEYTARGNSLAISAGGLTVRGPEPRHGTSCPVERLPQAYEAIKQVSAGSHHFAIVHQSGALYTWGVGISGRLGLDRSQDGNSRADCNRPALVQALASEPVIKVACGRSHTACITAARDCYVWGSATTGKLGLGESSPPFDSFYSPIPIALTFSPGRSRRVAIRNISCGSAHSAATSTDGQLYVWGSGDGGRLGLGEAAMSKTHWLPKFVESLAGEHIANVSCGNAHTLVSTAIVSRSQQQAQQRNDVADKPAGGTVYAAGSLAVLGRFCPSFERVFPPPEVDGTAELPELAASQVSAGFGHSAIVTVQGELYCWGNNQDGCCGQPTTTKFLAKPTLVDAIYRRPANMAFCKPACQSSVYAGLDARLATDGNCDGSMAKHCASTQQDPQAWWEVDLGDLVTLACVKVWNRTDVPSDQAAPRDKFSSRLAPSWLMASQRPFERSVGGDSLVKSLSLSIARTHVTRPSKCIVWRCPEATVARYVRLQLESFDFLHVAQVQVFGIDGISTCVGKCNYVDCGRHATVAVVRPLCDPADIERAYARAVAADAFNADVLRLRETYALEYDKLGRGKHHDQAADCVLCTGRRQCEICEMRANFDQDLKHVPRGLAGRVLTLNETAKILLDAPKPPLNYTPKSKPKVGGSITAALAPRLQGSTSSDADANTVATSSVDPGAEDDPPEKCAHTADQMKVGTKRSRNRDCAVAKQRN